MARALHTMELMSLNDDVLEHITAFLTDTPQDALHFAKTSRRANAVSLSERVRSVVILSAEMLHGFCTFLLADTSYRSAQMQSFTICRNAVDDELRARDALSLLAQVLPHATGLRKLDLHPLEAALQIYPPLGDALVVLQDRLGLRYGNWPQELDELSTDLLSRTLSRPSTLELSGIPAHFDLTKALRPFVSCVQSLTLECNDAVPEMPDASVSWPLVHNLSVQASSCRHLDHLSRAFPHVRMLELTASWETASPSAAREWDHLDSLICAEVPPLSCRIRRMQIQPRWTSLAELGPRLSALRHISPAILRCPAEADILPSLPETVPGLRYMVLDDVLEGDETCDNTDFKSRCVGAVYELFGLKLEGVCFVLPVRPEDESPRYFADDRFRDAAAAVAARVPALRYAGFKGRAFLDTELMGSWFRVVGRAGLLPQVEGLTVQEGIAVEASLLAST